MYSIKHSLSKPPNGQNFGNNYLYVLFMTSAKYLMPAVVGGGGSPAHTTASTINVELLLGAAIEISELQQQPLSSFSTSVADRGTRS